MNENITPLFPLYIPTKGRHQYLTTSKVLTKMGVAHNLIVEPLEIEAYTKQVTSLGLSATILPLDMGIKERYEYCDDLGLTISSGSGPSRNYAWEHSLANGHDFHWVMDDNIREFHRLHQNLKINVRTPSFWRIMEDFVLRYTNIGMAGPHYSKFIPRKAKTKPFNINTRIYSCNLIRNDIPFKWRGRYNEDTILSLDMLKAGWCTVIFHALLQDKMATQVQKGGNTDELYHGQTRGKSQRYAKHGTVAKSEMLARVHPDIAEVKWKFSRVHHHIDYSVFKQTLQRKKGLVIPDSPNNYGMELRNVSDQAESRVKQVEASGLFLSTRSWGGRESGAVSVHLKILNHDHDQVDGLLTGSTRRSLGDAERSSSLIVHDIQTGISPFYREIRGRISLWEEFYHELNVEALSKYKELFLIGGIDLWRAGLTRFGKRVGVFPKDKGGLDWDSHGKIFANVLALLKAHNVYGIPLHEFAYDPNEIPLSKFHSDFTPKGPYHTYHGYDIPDYGIKRLDSSQYYLQQNPAYIYPKSQDFVFGYTVLEGSNRINHVPFVDKMSPNFGISQIFVKNKIQNIDTFVDFTRYQMEISKSKYTLILPAYDEKCFSIFRFLEAIHRDCLPLIHPGCHVKDVEQSFGVSLSPLIRDTPFSSSERDELLSEYKGKMLKFEKGFIRDADQEPIQL
jgi:hypothetical protein